MTLTIGSLFSGYGGLDMAAESAFGAHTAWVADIDKGACKILAHRYPDVPNLGDITAINWATVEPVDIITGGSPCQDLSHAGKRAGMTDGTRSNLWVAMREAIAVIRPTYVIWENVRGAYSAAADSDLEHCPRCVGDPRDRGPVLRALGRVSGDLSDLGYVGQFRGLRAADVGASHGRFRVFAVARLADAQSDPRRLGHRDDVCLRGEAVRRAQSTGPSGPRLTLLPSPRTSDTNGAGIHGDGGMDLRTAVTLLPTPTTQDAANNGGPSQFDRNTPPLNTAVLLLPTPAVNDMGKAYTPDEWDAWTDKMKAAHGNGNGHGKSLEIEAARLLPTPRAGDGEKGGPNQRGSSGDLMMPSAVMQDFGQYGPAIAHWEQVTGMPAPAPTEPTGKGGAHRLSPRFTEWMMGLPSGWITDVPGISRNEALKACGNGVVPQQAYAAITDCLNTYTELEATA
jgi:DNA (cytosine-5)-methyltransferase 1